MPEALKLYHAPASPNSRRVRIFLAEKGLALTLVPVDLAEGEQRSDAYRQINPRQMVPTLVLEDGTAIGEVPAIWRYLEETYPAKPLLGATPREKALVTMWERRVAMKAFAEADCGGGELTPGRQLVERADLAAVHDGLERLDGVDLDDADEPAKRL